MGLFGITMPWESAEGEGFIAPWTEKVETPGGLMEVKAAGPGDEIVSGTYDVMAAAPPTPLPAGPTATFQEKMQDIFKGGGMDLGPAGPIQLLDGRGVNTGGPVVPGPGDDLAIAGVPPMGIGGVGGLIGWGLEKVGVPAAVATVGGLSLAGLLAARTKMPWETPAGEGMIAPWTQQYQTPAGDWAQEANRPPAALAAAPMGGLAGMTYAQLKGGVPVKAWTNASKDGRIPASVNFIKFSNGMMASQSLVDGSIQTWRPKKHIVISSNPRLSNIRKLYRVHKRVTKMVKKYTK